MGYHNVYGPYFHLQRSNISGPFFLSLFSRYRYLSSEKNNAFLIFVAKGIGI
jgi:hypothetical protein